ncbi:MAG: hypothetical protein H0X39_01750 [Actinobacteria bacterium]|nr:hypothetical protein [Actinomycetota bacterium]
MRKREAVLLQDAALDSIILAVDHFNRAVGPSRLEASIIFAQRALELLLKSAIYEQTGKIREKGEDYTYGFKKCLNVATDQLGILSLEERISLQALEADRDAATHHLIESDEPLLYIKVQSAVTIFGALLHRVFDEQLTDYLPMRALPVSAEPPSSLAEALDAEIVAVRALVAPKKRQGVQARARLRPLLNLEAAVWGRAERPTEKELDRAMAALREGRDWRVVFPGVATLELESDPGDSHIPVAIRLTRSEGPPVHRVQGGDDAEALAFREVNPFDRWSLRLSDVAQRVGLSRPRTLALVEHLGLKDDEEFYKEIALGGDQIIPRYSQRAVERIGEALGVVDMDEVWRNYQQGHRYGQRG